MTVKVLVFAQLADRVGLSELTLSLPQDSTARELVDLMKERHPAAGPWLDLSRLAVNWEYAQLDTRLADGDEAALIPPVSGG
ncbi:MAG: MoaD/ThiS family protein [Candidatus Omnitrophica bacterium]|nr:MoaD/ThiS family protein [Candidatus Omnitrophota bacterium]